MRPLGATQETRRTYGVFTTGSDYTESRGAATDSTIWISIQPMSRAERQEFLEVFGATAEFKGYTSTAVRPLDEENRIPADEIITATQTFRVVATEPHGWGLTHTKAYLITENA